MRYEFVGRKTKNVGKTLWEIVGNLKNFGVGRLVKTSSSILFPEISYFRIIRVQPLPPPSNKFENRNVLIWVDEVFRGRKRDNILKRKTDKARYQLIPKIEEGKYLDVKLEPPVKYVSKYCSWPPLYKKLWEAKQGTEIPKLQNITVNYEGFNVIAKEAPLEPNKSTLYKGELSVHEMYLEIVRLKKLIKEHKET